MKHGLKQKFALAVMMVLCGLLSSCKKPISGQVFIVTEAGLNIPLGAVEIEVVNGKDAANFLNQRQTEIESKTRSLQNAYNEAKTNFDAASQVKSQAQAALKTTQNDQSWTNDTQYIALSNEKEKDRRVINNLFTSYIAGTSYGFGPAMPNDAGYRNYVEAEKQTQSLQKRVSEITSQCEVIKNNFLTPFQQANPKAFATLEQAQTKFGDAAAALKNFPTANDYFGDFSPKPIETIVTDAEGNFIIQNPKDGAKVFAKAQRQTLDSVENYFWLVDIPATGGKFILSNNNMFTVPTNSP